ncbi:MAG: hypothetical protein Q8R70_04450, partial [Methanoregula sp.]|nr:hypothetical protein [Methanoregula sp.]
GPFTLKHAHLRLLSAMGIFLDGFDLFVMSIALPLMGQTKPEIHETRVMWIQERKKKQTKNKKKLAVKNNSEAGLPVFGEAVPAINRS